MRSFDPDGEQDISPSQSASFLMVEASQKTHKYAMSNKNSTKKSDYNSRIRYYDSIRKGHGEKGSFLKIPSHIANTVYNQKADLVEPIMIPFKKNRMRDTKLSSIGTTFSCWNTMLGSGIVTLPWTFYHSGVILGTIISFCSFVASLRTCILILRLTGPKEDFYDTMRK